MQNLTTLGKCYQHVTFLIHKLLNHMAYCGVISKNIVQGYSSWECILDFQRDFDS